VSELYAVDAPTPPRAYKRPPERGQQLLRLGAVTFLLGALCGVGGLLLVQEIVRSRSKPNEPEVADRTPDESSAPRAPALAPGPHEPAVPAPTFGPGIEPNGAPKADPNLEPKAAPKVDPNPAPNPNLDFKIVCPRRRGASPPLIWATRRVSPTRYRR
jgi:hypothetical protein